MRFREMVICDRKSNIKRIDDKFERMKYALRRFRKKHTEKEYIDYRKKKIDNALEGLKIYKALDQPLFKKGKQYKHIEKLSDGIPPKS